MLSLLFAPMVATARFGFSILSLPTRTTFKVLGNVFESISGEISINHYLTEFRTTQKDPEDVSEAYSEKGVVATGLDGSDSDSDSSYISLVPTGGQCLTPSHHRLGVFGLFSLEDASDDAEIPGFVDLAALRAPRPALWRRRSDGYDSDPEENLRRWVLERSRWSFQPVRRVEVEEVEQLMEFQVPEGGFYADEDEEFWAEELVF